jgi:DNA/RNA endonuclease YhcR with UshA esterase domain
VLLTFLWFDPIAWSDDMTLFFQKISARPMAFIVSLFLLLPVLAGADAVYSPFPGSVPAQEITTAQIGKDLAIAGEIVKIIPSTGERVPYRLYLVNREPGSVIVVYWPDVAGSIHGDQGTPSVGTKVSATGKLSEYKGSLQIRIKNKAQLRMDGYPLTLGAATSAPGRVADALVPASSVVPTPDKDGYFTADDPVMLKTLKGQKFSVHGTVKAYKAAWNERAPNVISLKGAGELDIVFWTTEADEVPDYSVVGTPIYVSGALQEYKGHLQLKVSELADLSTTPLPAERILKPKAPGSGPKSTKEKWPDKQTAKGVVKPMASVVVARGAFVKVRDISPEHVESEVMIRGEVKSILDDGSVMVDDPTATIRVNLPSGGSDSLSVGIKVMVLGKVIYHKQRSGVELEVSSMDDVNKLQ